jgi:hypothetical protein
MYSDGSVKFLFSGTGNNIGDLSSTVVQNRSCVIGEVIRDNVCQECPPPTYSLDNSSISVCKGCPDFALCKGGAVVVPMDSFWHSGHGATWPQCTQLFNEGIMIRWVACGRCNGVPGALSFDMRAMVSMLRPEVWMMNGKNQHGFAQQQHSQH